MQLLSGATPTAEMMIPKRKSKQLLTQELRQQKKHLEVGNHEHHLNESLGAVEYDGLINSAYPADVIHASLATGYGELKRGCLIAKASNGSLIPWGSDITDDLSEALTVTAHVATKSQTGLRIAQLKVYAAEFLNETQTPDEDKKATFAVAGLDTETLVVKAKKRYSESALSVSDHVATDSVVGLDTETVVIVVGDATLEEGVDYELSYNEGTLTITLKAESDHYSATELDVTADYAAYDALTADTHYTAAYASGVLTITMVDSTDYTNTSSVKVYCEYDDDIFALIEPSTQTVTKDYTAAYAANELTVTLDETSEYYDTPKVKVVCPYTYDEGTIAGANLILAEDVDTGLVSGQTVVARAYRTGIFNDNKLSYDAKAIDGINAVTKEKLRSVGILLNDSISLS